MVKPDDGEIVWIEYPEGRHLRAKFDSASDTFAPFGEHPIAASAIANWSREEHEDYDISDDPQEGIKGNLTRD